MDPEELSFDKKFSIALGNVLHKLVLVPLNEKISSLRKRQDSSEKIITDLTRRVSELERRN